MEWDTNASLLHSIERVFAEHDVKMELSQDEQYYLQEYCECYDRLVHGFFEEFTSISVDDNGDITLWSVVGDLVIQDEEAYRDFNRVVSLAKGVRMRPITDSQMMFSITLEVLGGS